MAQYTSAVPGGSGRNSSPILLADEDETARNTEERENDLIREQVREYGRHQAARGFAPPGFQATQIIDLADEIDGVEADLEENLEKSGEIQFVDLTGEQSRKRRNVPATLSRNPPLNSDQFPLELVDHQGHVLKKGVVVELANAIGQFHVEFLKIQAIISDTTTDRVLIRGQPFARTRDMNGQLPRKLNEVVLVLELDDDDPRSLETQAIVEVQIGQVTTVRHLHFTNASFPANRFEFGCHLTTMEDVAKKGPLICRWRAVFSYQNAAMRKAGRAHEWALVHVRGEDATRRFRVDDDTRLNEWRGGKVPGGSHGAVGGAPMVSLDFGDEDADVPMPMIPLVPAEGQKYSCGDVFSGAGGASRGMERAGFNVSFAVDHWHHACETYERNFPETHLHAHDVNDFIKDPEARYRVDVLHLSPPCQVWSPAHTIPGARDDENIAVLFSCTHLISKIRPRYFTLEQTFGILHNRCRPYFNVLVLGFTEHGYSVRFKIVHLATWGLAQARKRLIMVGACPGEPLPPLPGPTHSGDPADGLPPFVTVRQALSRIRPSTTLHNPRQVTRFLDENRKVPWNPDSILPRTITTSGGQNYFYDGSRDLTLREFACLQGFPIWHKFVAPSIKKQIGNAFPPCVVRVLYAHLKRWMQEQDGVVPEETDARRSISSVPLHLQVAEEEQDEEDIIFVSEQRHIIDLEDHASPPSRIVIDLEEPVSPPSRFNVPMFADRVVIMDLEPTLSCTNVYQDTISEVAVMDKPRAIPDCITIEIDSDTTTDDDETMSDMSSVTFGRDDFDDDDVEILPTVEDDGWDDSSSESGGELSSGPLAPRYAVNIIDLCMDTA